MTRWKSFPLRPFPTPGRRFNDHIADAWARAEALGEGVRFVPWNKERDLPSSSMPALEAARCALLQGDASFEAFHLRLLKAYFEEGQDISQRETLLAIAGQANLDLERWAKDFDSGSQRDVVLSEYKEGLEAGVTAIPTVFFTREKASLKAVGGVPVATYRRLMDLLLT